MTAITKKNDFSKQKVFHKDQIKNSGLRVVIFGFCYFPFFIFIQLS